MFWMFRRRMYFFSSFFLSFFFPILSLFFSFHYLSEMLRVKSLLQHSIWMKCFFFSFVRWLVVVFRCAVCLQYAHITILGPRTNKHQWTFSVLTARKFPRDSLGQIACTHTHTMNFLFCFLVGETRIFWDDRPMIVMQRCIRYGAKRVCAANWYWIVRTNEWTIDYSCQSMSDETNERTKESPNRIKSVETGEKPYSIDVTWTIANRTHFFCATNDSTNIFMR